MERKIKILVVEGDLLKAPGAILEFYSKTLVGGIAARGGGWHEYPRLAWGARPYREETLYAPSVDELKQKISRIYPESKYILEYV